MKEQIINKTFSYKGIGNMLYVVVVLGYVLKNEQYDADSYIGKQTLICPNGESLTSDWSCITDYFEKRVKSGEYKTLR